MPQPGDERQVLEQERSELKTLLATYVATLKTTPSDDRIS